MPYPNMPSNLNLRPVQVTDSEVMSWNTIDDFCATHQSDQVLFVPSFIEGDTTSLVFSKRGNYAHVGDVEIHKLFYTEEEAWEEACYDAIQASGSDEVSCAAQTLLNSMEWWTNR